MYATSGDADPAGPDLPSFVIVNTQSAATTVRVRTETETGITKLRPLPGRGGLAGVVFVDRPGIAGCGEPVPSSSLRAMRVELLDGNDNIVKCVGLPPKN